MDTCYWSQRCPSNRQIIGSSYSQIKFVPRKLQTLSTKTSRCFCLSHKISHQWHGENPGACPLHYLNSLYFIQRHNGKGRDCELKATSWRCLCQFCKKSLSWQPNLPFNKKQNCSLIFGLLHVHVQIKHLPPYHLILIVSLIFLP